MAYTTPSTQPTGTLITSTHYKAHLIDNIKFLHGPPTVRVRRAAAQSIASGSWEEISFDTEDWDTDTMWSSTAATKLFARTAGKYQIAVRGTFAASTAGRTRAIGARKNSTSSTPDIAVHVHDYDIPSGSLPVQSAADMVSLTTGQYVQVCMVHDVGVNHNTDTNYGGVVASLLWVSS